MCVFVWMIRRLCCGECVAWLLIYLGIYMCHSISSLMFSDDRSDPPERLHIRTDCHWYFLYRPPRNDGGINLGDAGNQLHGFVLAVVKCVAVVACCCHYLLPSLLLPSQQYQGSQERSSRHEKLRLSKPLAELGSVRLLTKLSAIVCS